MLRDRELPSADRQKQNRQTCPTAREDSMTRSSQVPKFLMLACSLVLFLKPEAFGGQSISEQKKAVVFIFGIIHPLKPDKTAMTDRSGNPLAVTVPLGTGFLVSYADHRYGPHNKFSYLVTAKHVLKDADGTFLPRVTIRLNLKSPVGDSAVGFIRDIPVTDAQGFLSWFHSEDEAEDVAILPLLPDEREFDFSTISTRTFVRDQALTSGALAEGDDLYFIGLMEQYYGTNRNYPLVRRGSLALLTGEYIETPSGRQQIFVAELESWPGNSGSPVFLLPRGADRAPAKENNFKFLGMIVASFVNRFSIPLNAGQSAGSLEGGDTANTGMTCIVPATMIEKVLDSEPAQRAREERIQMPSAVDR
jgi:trypsin-like peptidase